MNILLSLLFSLLLVSLIIHYGCYKLWKADEITIAKLQAALIEKNLPLEKKHRLEIEDLTKRYDELRKIPVLACFTDAQVAVLADILAVHLREILDSPEEMIN